MEVDHHLFFSQYLLEYHRVRVLYLENLLKDPAGLKGNLDSEYSIDNISNRSELIVRLDIRQNYFHAIETFFELFFAFLPKNSHPPDERKIVRQLVKANWRNNYKEIKRIAEGKKKVESLLSKMVQLGNREVSTCHYLFYPGIYDESKFPKELMRKIGDSIPAIQSGIVSMALDFIQRAEYNAYKHGMRAYPSYEAAYLVNVDTKKAEHEFGLENSVSFHDFNDDSKEVIIETRVLDTKRDIRMTHLASNLIRNMILYRHLILRNSASDTRKSGEKIAIYTFGKDEVAECVATEVEIGKLTMKMRDT